MLLGQGDSTWSGTPPGTPGGRAPGAPPGRAREISGPGPGRAPGARGAPRGPRRGPFRDPRPGPQFGPLWGPYIYIFIVLDPPPGGPSGVHFVPPQGGPGGPPARGAKKCTFFWVFNNSPSRDSLGPFFPPPGQGGFWDSLGDSRLGECL